MLAHSPPLPLTIHMYDRNREMTAQNEASVLLALRLLYEFHRDRTHRIGIWTPKANLGKLIKALDGQFPILECMYFPISGRRGLSSHVSSA
jgi:hypothetical protein